MNTAGIVKNLVIGPLLMVLSFTTKAEDSWLDSFNKSMASFNESVSSTLTGVSDSLPTLPPAVTQGARNFAVTWISEPLNIGAYLIAGRTDGAGIALDRMAINISQGWLGFVDRAAEEGIITPPIDYGLALCSIGVPSGEFIVVPFTGVRTVRDFFSDWVAAHVVLYSAIFGVVGLPISLQTLAAVEAVEEVITLSIAGEIGEVPEEAKVKDLAVAQKNYLAGRQLTCSALSSGEPLKH